MPWTPNVLTNVGDIKVAQTALQPFLKTLLPVAAFSRNFSPNPADKGDMIRVPIVGAPAESSDFQGDYTANSGADIQTVPVVLNRHKYKTVHVTATEAADTALNVLETLVVSAAQQLAIDVVQDIFTAITAAAYGAPAIPPLAPSDFNYKAVLGVREACAQAKMPVSERSLILDSSYYTNLLADDVVAKSFNLNLSAPGVVEGDVKRLAGFDIYETLAIPHDAGRPVRLCRPSLGPRHRDALPPAGRAVRGSGRGHRPCDGPHLRLSPVHPAAARRGVRHP